MKKVTVYGSLLKGLGNHRLLDNNESTLLGEHTIDEELSMISMSAFPGLVRTPGKRSTIFVETYEVSDRVFKNIEWLEGYPSFYDREKINTPFGESEVYVLAKSSLTDTSRLVPADEDGIVNWRKFRMK